MPAYLCISIGTDPDTARPILASMDPEIVEGAVTAILGKVSEQTPRPPARAKARAA